MSRTAGRLAVLAALGLLAVGLGPVSVAPAQTTAPPSIVLVVTDDQRWDTLWAMPSVEADLVDNGVVFSNGFVVNALCCPSRASILTGRYSHGTGVYTNTSPDGGFSIFDDDSTVATWIDNAGYRTALVGKYLNQYDGVTIPPGWDHWVAFSGNQGSYYDYSLNVDGVLEPHGSAPEDYSTDVLATHAESFILGVPAEEPLLLYMTPYAPHGPATAATRHVGAFAGLEPHRPPSYNEADVSDKPAYIQQIASFGRARQSSIDALRVRQHESLLAVDEAITRIVDALDATGRLANTMIVLTSDNGFQWGEHRWQGKQVPYDESIRVPFVVRYDPLVPGPDVDGRLVLNIDLAPTFAALAGVEAPGADGASVLPLLDGTATSWRRDFLVEHVVASPRSPPTYCAVRSTGYSYAVYSTGEEELYNLALDPYQLRNALGRNPRALDRMRVRARELCDPTPPGFSFPA